MVTKLNTKTTPHLTKTSLKGLEKRKENGNKNQSREIKSHINAQNKTKNK